MSSSPAEIPRAIELDRSTVELVDEAADVHDRTADAAADEDRWR